MQRIKPGIDNSTPEVEHELMLLWDAVERDRAALGGPSASGLSREDIAGILRVPLESHDQPAATGHGSASADAGPLGDSAAAHIAAAEWRARDNGEGATAGNVFADQDVFADTASEASAGRKAVARAPEHSGGGFPAEDSETLVSIALEGIPAKAAGTPARDAAHAQECSGGVAKEHLYDLEAPFWRVLVRQLASSGRLLAHALAGGEAADAEAAGERRAVRIALALAVFNQIGASTSLINYAPEVLQDAGVQTRQRAMQLSAAIGGFKTLGILLGAAHVLSHIPVLPRGEGGGGGASILCVLCSRPQPSCYLLLAPGRL